MEEEEEEAEEEEDKSERSALYDGHGAVAY